MITDKDVRNWFVEQNYIHDQNTIGTSDPETCVLAQLENSMDYNIYALDYSNLDTWMYLKDHRIVCPGCIEVRLRLSLHDFSIESIPNNTQLYGLPIELIPNYSTLAIAYTNFIIDDGGCTMITPLAKSRFLPTERNMINEVLYNCGYSPSVLHSYNVVMAVKSIDGDIHVGFVDRR